MTVVRIAVARFESTSFTPTLARIAVAPAKSAERIAQANQLLVMPGVCHRDSSNSMPDFRPFVSSRRREYLRRPTIDEQRASYQCRHSRDSLLGRNSRTLGGPDGRRDRKLT